MKEYDVVVLGAGPGGYVSAIRAAQLGAKTAIIEKKCVGGTCLNVGCIPTKALIKNVEILHSIKAGKQRGITVQGVELDFAKGMKAKNKAVKQLTNGVAGLLAANGIEMYDGAGIVTANKTVIIEGSNEKQEISFKKLIIATGSKPAKPPVEGMELEGVLTSDELLSISDVPKELVIIGGGVIGCEFASIFNAYGSKVTIIEMMPELVAIMDNDISMNIEASLRNENIAIKTNMQVKRIEHDETGMLNVVIVDKDGCETVITGDKVLVSTGRRPNTEGLEALKLDIYRGFIVINEKLETTAPDVYAIGDVTGKRQLAHVASEMGVWAAENALGADNTLNLEVVPSCIYTIPEIGSVGMSEKEANDKGHRVLVGRFPLVACGKAVATGDSDGLFKIIADAETKKILGVHLIGKSATELIAEATAYMHMDATIEDIVGTIHSHPTISEAIAEAARDAEGICIHMPKK